KIAKLFVNHYKLTLQTSLLQLSSYIEELASKLSNSKTKEQVWKARDQAKRRFQELELSKELADILIPIQSPGRHVDERDSIKIIVQNIIKNNLLPKEISGLAYNLASSAPTTKKFRKDLTIQVSFNAKSNRHNNNAIYAIGRYEVEEPRLLLSMEKNPIRARELLIWIQRSILDKFPFLLKDKDRNTNIVLLNQFLSCHRITSFILKKIGANLASKVHGGRNDSYHQYLRQLACRHKIGHASSVEYNGVINDRPNTLAH
ncbi:22476_t:CDS:2, partial [Gigaspora rosea]